jgi:hypothetical protein
VFVDVGFFNLAFGLVLATAAPAVGSQGYQLVGVNLPDVLWRE